MEQITLTPFENVLDDFYGKIGTPERDAHEQRVSEALNTYKLGEAIKTARLQNKLTQEELGKKLGVQKSQISKLERGYSLTLSTMSRVFKVLGVSTATLDLGDNLGKIALW